MTDSTQTSGTQTGTVPTSTTDYRAMSLVTALFFMWGFITVLNDILIPHLKSIFDLNYAEVMLVQFAFFSAYFVFSFPSGKFIDHFGFKRAMVGGLLTMGVGAILFVPAASIPSFPLFLSALIVLAAGMTLLQTCANPYVAVLGPPKTASSRLNLAQAFNSLGTTLAPIFGSRLILGGVAAPLAAEILSKYTPAQLQAYRISQAASVKTPYIILSAMLLVLAVVIALSKLPSIPEAEAHGDVHESIWRYRHLVLGAIAIFVYVGAEVVIGSLLTNYLNHPEIGNLSLQDAANKLSFYWGGAMVGRFVGAALLQKMRTERLLTICAVAACGLVLTSTFTTGLVAMWSLIAVGLCNSIMFPGIFTLGISGLGKLTGDGSGLLVAAIIGGAIIPEVQSVIADHMGLHISFLVPAVCYIYIAFYGLSGFRPTQAKAG